MFCGDSTTKNSQNIVMPESVVVLKRIKIIPCKKCRSGFTKQSEYKLHKLKHDLENIKRERRKKNRSLYMPNNPVGYKKKFKCDECDMKFVEKSTMSAHLALHKPFPYICNCGIGYYGKEDLTCHIKIVHDNETAKEMRPKKPKNMLILGSKKPGKPWNKSNSEK